MRKSNEVIDNRDADHGDDKLKHGFINRQSTLCIKLTGAIAFVFDRIPCCSRRLSYFAAMFKRQEASHLREEFWTVFGRYMNPVPSSEGMKINWINYRTTFKDVYFRMEVNQKSAMISIALTHRDAAIRELYFQQFQELKTLLHTTLEEEWQWQPQHRMAEDKIISSIYKELPDVSVFNKDHWPELISFFKPRMMALDRFWEDAKYSFESLR